MTPLLIIRSFYFCNLFIYLFIYLFISCKNYIQTQEAY